MGTEQVSSTTGIKYFDHVLHGGFPKGEVVMLTGASGTGKTIFAFQWLFQGVKEQEPGIYLTMTEPLFMSLKNLETLSFYNRAVIEEEQIKIVDLRTMPKFAEIDEGRILHYIEQQVIEQKAKRLCIDSITAIAYRLGDKGRIRNFIFRLGKLLATLGCTTILTGELPDERRLSVYGVEEFISDAIIKMERVEQQKGTRRQLTIVKMRGRAYREQKLYFKITQHGLCLFPKFKPPLNYTATNERLSTGNRRLDTMFRGGVFKGSSTFIAGSTGTGKSVFALQFIMEGLLQNESCLYVSFEESREQLILAAERFGVSFTEYEEKGLLTLHCVYPGDQYTEEHFINIRRIIEKQGIVRCVVDSLSALTHAFGDEDFSSFIQNLYRYFKMKNVTTFFTSATDSFMGKSSMKGGRLSTITDNIIMLRHVEMQGELRQVMNIVKVRGSSHSKVMRMYEIGKKGLIIGHSLSGYEGVTTGIIRKVSESMEELIQLEFKRYLGPMGIQIFSDLSSQGLAEEKITEYIDSLVSDGILKQKDAQDFKDRILKILAGISLEKQGRVEAG